MTNCLGEPKALFSLTKTKRGDDAVLTDTHSLVWHFTEDPRLSKKAADAFERTVEDGLIIVPSIVLAEIMFIAQKGRINISFDETVKKIEEYDNFDIASLDAEILMTAFSITADVEMHDRLIMATAIYFDAALLTRDKQISETGVVATIW